MALDRLAIEVRTVCGLRSAGTQQQVSTLQCPATLFMRLVTAKVCLVLVLLRILRHAAISWDSHSITPPASGYLEPTGCSPVLPYPH